ncbi:MAG: ATP-binding protein, partial [Planctomycetaceae bacterium]|nr:ATP-binding protein [Planctomycetaceae bacterium]
TGLGLFVCRNIIEQLGGSLQLSETSPAGTTFTVTIALDEPTGPTPTSNTESIPSVAEVGSC